MAMVRFFPRQVFLWAVGWYVHVSPDVSMSFRGSAKTLIVLRVIVQQAEANHTSGQGVPRFLNDVRAVVADAHPAQPFEPTDGALDHPAYLPQPAAVRCSPASNVRLDSQPRQDPPCCVAVV